MLCLEVLYNYTYQPYEVKAEDITLYYKGKDKTIIKIYLHRAMIIEHIERVLN